MINRELIEGACHCGAVTWQFDGVPEGARACNCTICRRYGVLWAYDYADEGIRVSGTTRAYLRGNALGFHFCPECGCVAYWLALESDDDGRRRIAVNLRLAEPETVAEIPAIISTAWTPSTTCRGTVVASRTTGSEKRCVRAASQTLD